MIDTSKQYTVGGQPARFLGKLEGNNYPLVYAIRNSLGESVLTFTENGQQFMTAKNPDEDLVEVPPKLYRLVYHDGYVHTSGPVLPPHVARHYEGWRESKEAFDDYDPRGRAGFLVKQGDKVTWEPIE